jgi:flagellar hook assembly protein FlgD
VPQPSQVTIKIYNALGQVVRTVVDKKYPVGKHTIEWDGRNDSRQLVASGLYLVRLQAGERVMVRKMMLVR